MHRAKYCPTRHNNNPKPDGSLFRYQGGSLLPCHSYSRTREHGQPWISASFSQNLRNSLTALRQANAEHGMARSQLEGIQNQRRAEVDTLARRVRDFFQVLRRRNQRERLGMELETLYKRPKRMPQWAPAAQWLQWAKDIISGEALAVAQGFPAMVNPSSSEIQGALTQAAACEELWAESIQLSKARELDLRLAREQATRVLRGLAMRLRETLAHEVPATRRELMRTFGFRFISTGAKDRQQPKPGGSQLANLVGRTPHPQEPASEPSDRDPELERPLASTPQAAAATIQQESPQPQPSQTEAPAADQRRDKQLKLVVPGPKAEPASTKKLSRRQKKAQRRAMLQAQNAVPDGHTPSSPRLWPASRVS